MGTPKIFERDDYSVVVKNRANGRRPWRWEIYRAARTSPVEQSAVYFETMATAHRAGKDALALFLAKRDAYTDKAPPPTIRALLKQ